MKEKKLIIHLIDSLTRGGAELLLINTINLLPQFQHVVIYLNEPNTFCEYFNKQEIKFICLHHKNWTTLPHTVIRLTRLIRQMQPILVHSHLFYSTFFARLAVPASVQLVSTIHSLYSKDAFEKNKRSLLVEKLTLQKRHTLIAVSKIVLKDYLQYVPFQGKSFVLYNFLPDYFFKKKLQDPHQDAVKCIAVGNLKEAKNYPYLLSIFRHLKNENISLDIYGTGPLDKELQSIIDRENLNVKLCGGIDNVCKVLHLYELFFQASSHEGFGLSVIEAMASKIPLIISDIPVFREITNELAHFFPLDDSSKAAASIKKAVRDKIKMSHLGDQAFIFAKDQYSAQLYVEKLLIIYEEITNIKLSGSTCVE